MLTDKRFLLCFFACWAGMLLLANLPAADFARYVIFTLLGVVGAIFANSTGAGGGVVFIPMFNQLNFTETQAIATSFGIQCFGMAAGGITWWRHYHSEKRELRLWQGFKRIILIATLASITGIWLIYGTAQNSPASLSQSFSWFSLLLGIFIIASVYLIRPKRESSQLMWWDYLAIVLICLTGGAITAWLSVGVGEMLAIYLILRRFDVTMAVAAAVIVSAFTVWSAIWQHTLISFDVYWQVVLFAGPGAVIGGIIAKTLVTYLSATRLKLFFAFWLLVIGGFGV